MSEHIFKIGDVVIMKGQGMQGTPKMTVCAAPRHNLDETHVGCMWFDGATLERGTFHQDTLSLFKEIRA